jgi:molecular chaperone GrpE
VKKGIQIILSIPNNLIKLSIKEIAMESDIYKGGQNLLQPTDVEAEIRSLEEELSNERDRTLRALADFKNYRQRTEREGNRIAEESKRKIMLALLEIIDDMEKAVDCAKNEKQPSVEGVQIIHKKFLAVLESHGVLPFECIGCPFDHNLHEAVAMATHEGSEPRIVVDVLRRGYLFNNELLRPAQVRVS